MRLHYVAIVQFLLSTVLLFGGTQAALSAPLQLSEPASYAGVLACADCPGVAWHLDLWPDGRYQLRRDYLEREGSNNDLGRWRVNPADDSLLLHGGREAPLRLAVVDSQTLRLLDLNGRPIESTLPYELTRLEAFKPVEMSLPLWGEFRYFADAASLEECLTGHRYPVLMEGEYLNLEQRYLELRRGAAAEDLFVHVDATILNRRVHESEGPAQSLRIERFVSDVPGLRCERAMSSASLPNTYWRLLRIDAATVGVYPGVRELQLVLRDVDGIVVGFSGCNRFRGAYSVTGRELVFGLLAGTRMACPEPQMDLEQRFHTALGQTRQWRIDGQTLELFDADGDSRLVFQAVYLP